VRVGSDDGRADRTRHDIGSVHAGRINALVGRRTCASMWSREVLCVDVEDLLVQQRAEVLEDALAALRRSHLVHYEQSGEEFNRERLAELFDLVVSALRSRQLGPVSRYCEELGQQRFEAGFGISEVQTAFNVLEEAMWRRVVDGVQPVDLAEAIGLLSTILGFGKDVLARRYVSLASQRHVPTLDLSALFAGIEN
jgi:hypothetical protein